MAFLGDFGEFFSDTFTGKNLVPNLLTAGGYGVLTGSLQQGSKVLAPLGRSLVGSIGGSAKRPSPTPIQQNPGGYNYYSNQPPYPQPSYTQPGYFDPSPLSYPPAEQYGGTPWGSSMTYSTPFPVSPVTYSAPSRPAWEDLVVGALPFFL